MLITSATTVNTLTYLSLYELEQYKKQFQSFWLPFMEQFVPATTIWVAGERWCNEPCTIINPCDYDFELVEAEVSIEPVPAGFFPPPPKTVGVVINIPVAITASLGTTGNPTATPIISTPFFTPVIDLGLTKSEPILRTVEQASIDIASYRSRFTSVETIIV